LLLADLTGATDVRLRALARALAGRIVVDLARHGTARRRGLGQLRMATLPDTGGDLDLDSSLEALTEARLAGRAVSWDELRGVTWQRREMALCLVVDRSGSMGGERLATAALAAAAIALRAPDEHSVLVFSGRVDALVEAGTPRPVDAVVEQLLALRGHGTTDLVGALRSAGEQLARSRAARKVCVLLSDCRSSVDEGLSEAVEALDELVVIAPAGDADDARALALSAGARFGSLAGPSAVAQVLNELLAG
jgi:Mg-chelatase subunit ChlD